MPYITQDLRKELKPHSTLTACDPGELNYQLTCLCKQYIRDHGLIYDTINEVIGVLECAKQELYRRMAVPYEDGKIATNGDVYD